MNTRKHVVRLSALLAVLVAVGCMSVLSNRSRQGAGDSEKADRVKQPQGQGHDTQSHVSEKTVSLSPADRDRALEDLKAAIEGISKKLSDGHPWSEAAKELEAMRGRLSGLDIGELRKLIGQVTDPRALAVVLIALGRIEKKWAGSVLIDYVGSSDESVRVAAAFALAVRSKPPTETEYETSSGWSDRQRFLAAWQAGREIPFEVVMKQVGPVEDDKLRATLVGLYAKEPEIAARLFDLYLLGASSGYDDVVNCLAEHLRTNPFPLAREAAAQALSGTSSAEAREVLRAAIERDSEDGVRKIAIRSIGASGSEEDLAYLETRYPVTTGIGERREILGVLGTSKSDRFQRAMANVVATESETVLVTDAMTALTEIKSKYACDALIGRGSSTELFVRLVVAQELGNLGDTRGRSMLETLANDPIEVVRDAAQASLKKLPQ